MPKREGLTIGRNLREKKKKENLANLAKGNPTKKVPKTFNDGKEEREFAKADKIEETTKTSWV